MTSLTFEWAEDDEFGGYGWIPKGMTGFNACDGRLIAHDVLEHFRDDRGTIEGEMRALGTVLFGRGLSGHFSSQYNPDPAHHLSSDILYFLINIVENGTCKAPKPPNTYKLRDDYAEDIMNNIRLKVIKDLPQETDCFHANRAEYMKRLDILLDWMRIGFRKAVKKWGHDNGWNLTRLFERIAREVDENHKHGENYEELTVKVNQSNFTFNITQEYLEYD
jgi:hypothetical protein